MLFNETFAPRDNVDLVPKCVLWQEGECGHKAHNIANTYITYLKEQCMLSTPTSVTIYAENLYSALL